MIESGVWEKRVKDSDRPIRMIVICLANGFFCTKLKCTLSRSGEIGWYKTLKTSKFRFTTKLEENKSAENVLLWLVMHLPAAIPGGWPRGTPGHLHQDICKFHVPRAKYSFIKSDHCPFPGEHNLEGLQNCNVISYIIFNKSLTIINTVSKNS